MYLFNIKILHLQDLNFMIITRSDACTTIFKSDDLAKRYFKLFNIIIDLMIDIMLLYANSIIDIKSK